MDKTALVSLDIAVGFELIDALDAAALKPKVALWMETPEFEEGRLVLASPAFDQGNPLRAYQQVAHTLQDKFIHSRPPLLIMRMRDPFIVALRHLFAETRSNQGMRLGGQTIGNRFILEAYVYRIIYRISAGAFAKKGRALRLYPFHVHPQT